MATVPHFDASQIEASSKAYLDKHKIEIYLQDALSRLLDDRPEKPAKFLSEYFSSVHRGINTLLREYEYVRVTKQNRSAFIDRVADVIPNRSSTHTAPEYHHLIELLCPDFPLSIIHRATEIAAHIDYKKAYRPHELLRYKIPAGRFLGAFRAYFTYIDFFEHAHIAIRKAALKSSGASAHADESVDEVVCKTYSSREVVALGVGIVDAVRSLLDGEDVEFDIPPTLRVECALTTFKEQLQQLRDVTVGDAFMLFLVTFAQAPEERTVVADRGV
ncbi:uncharacterized protein EV422DRAFT_569115 [Fimicolochytrium jonesii]|uniref:uncharacterized protein n=1 Tax=Fimicolochytrium jonesii TaxID=1396493 RepID=UPI0022FDEFC3|nr:uncharacterized protein EV422DRAFT_569115 [Fimicolochytrium jonesii]KAI8819241.1 hypothetical protein EV422DRAFT_569115 [Fimicolochytrium jonesii]